MMAIYVFDIFSDTIHSTDTDMVDRLLDSDTYCHIDTRLYRLSLVFPSGVLSGIPQAFACAFKCLEQAAGFKALAASF